MSSYARVIAAVVLSLPLLWQVGCHSQQTLPRTEILLQVDADREIRGQADRLTLEISSGEPGALRQAEPEVFDLADEGFRWPASLALVAKASHEAHAFEVTITVEKSGEPLARGRVLSTFLKQQTLLLKTSLFSACIGKLDCGDDQTCVGAQGGAECVSAVVEASQLPTYDPEQAAAGAGSTAGGNGGNGGSAGASVDSGTDGGSPDRDAATSDGGRGDGDAATSGSDAGTDSGADSGLTPGCISRGAEQCSNGLDDDCNGDIDCADTACSSMKCAPSGSVTGVLVPDGTPCPEGFQQAETTLYKGLTDQGCSGCSCATTATQCVPRVYYYASTPACTADSVVPYTGGTLITTPITEACSSEPIGSDQGMDTPVAWRVTMTTYPGACSASGSPTPLPAVWATTMKLCSTNARGGGCGAGFVCVP